ncbi:hypothetical protein FRACYDRAFT_138831, partial [Fragilariopsis cylindrus CCMP1102]
DDDNQDESCTYKSHFKDQSIPIYVRLGIFIFLLATSLLLLAADIGSGVTVDSILMEDGEVVEINAILNVSVISSVGKLWNTKSYPLAIFIAITSIGWPYVKLAIATYAWMMPYRNSRRRELLIEIIDVLGKWSFVDIMVLVEIMVAFRSTVDLGFGLKLEIVLVAQWGFYGFVVATMMSLLSTHVILHYHRKVNYHNNNNANDSNINTARDRLSTGFVVVAAISLLLSMIVYLAGVIVKSFEVTSTRGTESESTSYSITSIGLEISNAYIDSSHAGTRFIQAMWFFLAVVMPLWCSFLFLILYTFPGLSKIWMERIFTMAEIAFAWSCAEVLLISTVFAVLQMPIFGNGLVENDCTACFVITSRILPEFALLCVGTVLNVSTNVWLYRKAHSVIY